MDASEFWAVGDYSIIGDLWSAPGRDLAATLEVADRDVIDLATGTGVTAIAVAARGARSVVGVDATPSLLAEADRRAETAGVEIDWIEGDFAAVPRADGSADLVVSTFGLIFAADPAAAFVECRRLARPGGRIVFTSWSDNGLFGRFRDALGPHLPDAGPEPWHQDPDRIREVVGADAHVEERSFPMTTESAEAFVAQLEQFSAPFVLTAQQLGPRWAAARADLLRTVRDSGTMVDGNFVVDVPYLVTTLSVG